MSFERFKSAVMSLTNGRGVVGSSLHKEPKGSFHQSQRTSFTAATPDPGLLVCTFEHEQDFKKNGIEMDPDKRTSYFNRPHSFRLPLYRCKYA